MTTKFYMGCIPSEPDSRDYEAKDHISMGVCPAEYMPKYLAPTLSQGEVSSCVAHALATLKYYQEQRERGFSTELSTDFIYHNRQAGQYQGEGMQTREAVANVCKYGTCEKSMIPTNTEYPNPAAKAKIAAYAEKALEYSGLQYVRCRTMDEIKEAIFQHGGVMLSLAVYPRFMAYNCLMHNYKEIPVIEPRRDGEQYMGSHAVCAMGYTEKGIVIQNSWGADWGLSGFAILPWDYVIQEGWTIMDSKKQWDIAEFTIGDCEYTVNGVKNEIDVAPVILNGRTMLPIRAFEAVFGCEIEWKPDEQKVIVRKEVK